MKKLIYTLVFALAALTSFAQAPQSFKYQAVVRNAGGTILTAQAVGIQLTILQSSPTGTAVYTETFAPTTNSYGLVNLEIGTGVTVDDFTSIDWSNGPYFIETAVDVSGGTAYVAMGTSQLLSVPYALYAEQAGSAAIDNVDDADADPTNEIQVLSFSNDTLYLADGGMVYLGDYAIDNVNDADSDPTNEIQDISLLADQLSITSGSTVDLSSYLDNTDNQLLTYTPGTSTLDISNGNSVVLPDGDITEITAGNGLSGGGLSGAITLDVTANNGLTVNAGADAVQMGGALNQNTTIFQGPYTMTYDLNGTGDFVIQDAGVNHFEIRDNGLMYVGDDTYWRDGSTSGITIAALIDDADDGRFQLFENAQLAVDLDANTQFIFNELGLDRNFRVESNSDQYALFVDAGANSVGIGNALPAAKLQVSNGAMMPHPGLGAAGITFPPNYYGGGGDLASIQYYNVSGETTDLRISNENDWDDKISFFQSGGERMSIYNSNVGIGVTAPVYQLQVANNSAAKPLSSAWTVTSDRRLKKDIVSYTGGLDDILKINPVWFTYTGEAGMPQETGVGIIAQELQEIAPYMVSTWEYSDENGTTEYLGVDNGAMTYMLINAVQEQQATIESQQSELDEMRTLLLKLQERMDSIIKE